MTHEFNDDETDPGAGRPGGEAPDDTTDEVTVVSIGSEEGLIASVPAVLGFTPRESVVVLGQHGDARRGRLGAAMRADLPRDRRSRLMMLDSVVERMAATGADGVHVIVVTEGAATDVVGSDQAAWEGDLPAAELVGALEDEVVARRMDFCTAFWVPIIARGAPWRCYGPCRCAGVLPDPRATEVAAHQAVLGKVTFGSREEAEAALAPTPASVSARARHLLDAAHDQAAAARAVDHNDAARADLAAIRVAAAAVGAGRRLDEQSLATVAAALRDPAVRDVCLGLALGDDPEVHAQDAEQLWWAMTRATPVPEVAEPAALLAFTALARSGGPQTQLALDRARAADPGHRLSLLLDTMIRRGVPPAAMRKIAVEAAAEAAARLTG